VDRNLKRLGLDGSRFTKILGAVGLSGAGETIEFGIGGDACDLFRFPVASEHAHVAVIGLAATAGCFCHGFLFSVEIFSLNAMRDNVSHKQVERSILF
jgi:hypothetical protein